MKQKDFTPCCGCGQGVLHDNNITFYRFQVDQMIADPGAIRRTAGLAMMIGSTAIAEAMGPNEDLAEAFTSNRALLCLDCGLRMSVGEVAALLAAAAEKAAAGQ